LFGVHEMMIRLAKSSVLPLMALGPTFRYNGQGFEYQYGVR
jgi:hypothetical protein